MYFTGQGNAGLLQATCGSGTCTINADDSDNNGTYTQNQNPPNGTQLAVSITANGRGSFSGTGAPLFYLYDSSATGGGVLLSTNGVDSGGMYAQGAVPSSLDGLSGSYYMGSLFNWNSNGGSDSGSFTIDSLGNMTGNDDGGSQGNTDWGKSITGLTISSPPWSDGIFDLTAGGQTQLVCYLINPVCSGGSASCGGSGQTPYGMSACMSPTDNNPKVTLVQQVQ
jgi:hypothetical protein